MVNIIKIEAKKTSSPPRSCEREKSFSSSWIPWMEKRSGSSEMGMLCRLGLGLALSPDLASNIGLDFYTDEIQGGKRHGDLLALIHLKKMQTFTRHSHNSCGCQTSVAKAEGSRVRLLVCV